MKYFLLKLILCWILLLGACTKSLELKTVSVAEFLTFVQATNYVTDAEKFAWSIVQINITEFEVKENIDWRCPNALDEAKGDFPVTQVSYNDALAYTKWTNTRLPTYSEYWQLVAKDVRPINAGSPAILTNDYVNIVGNVWDITQPDKWGRIRLAGGSYLCNENTCNGTNKERELFVDQITGNTHIGFSVLR